MNECALCGEIGTRVDTTAGEIVGPGGIVIARETKDGELLLLAGRSDGSDTEHLYCVECSICNTTAEQFHRLLRHHHITRKRAADACGVSLATVHSWLRSDKGGRREMPERMLRLLRFEMGV